MPVRTGYVGTQVAGDVLTAANFTKLPGGWIGYAEVTANQTGITAEVDLTGLTVTVTVGASRRIRITGKGEFTNSAAGATMILKIYEGATLAVDGGSIATAGNGLGLHATVVLTPSGGAHTYKLRAVVGAGTGALSASAINPAFILVEDLGPAA